jgi:hypothetical protein
LLGLPGGIFGCRDDSRGDSALVRTTGTGQIWRALILIGSPGRDFLARIVHEACAYGAGLRSKGARR